MTGASTALDHRIGSLGAIILGAITGIGGGVLRDVLVRQVPIVLRTGLYAIPALTGAAIVVVAGAAGSRHLALPVIGAAVCFGLRVAALRYGWSVPRAGRPPEDEPPAS